MADLSLSLPVLDQMMKSVRSLLTAVVVVMVSVSSAPLPPSASHSRPDDQNAGPPHQLENSSTSEFPQQANTTLGDFRGDVSLNDTMNNTTYDFLRSTSQRCFLPTCLTANLGSDLQTGDLKAGAAARDPFGAGKK